MEDKELFTKDEMFDYLKNKIEKNKVSDEISGYFLFVEDKKSNGSYNIGQCSTCSLLQFLAKGIVSLAKRSGGNVLQTAIDAMHLACVIDSNKKEKENKQND